MPEQDKVRVVVAAPLAPELCDRIAAVDPRVEVVVDQELLPPMRHPADFAGLSLEELTARAEKDKATAALLDEIDVLVDGPYEEAQRDLTLHFRGSRNQRVIDMNRTRETKQIQLLYED